MPMQHLDALWKAVSAAGTVADIARRTQSYHFQVEKTITCYMQAEGVEVRLTRWEQPRIELVAQLQAAFGWRLAAEQDEAGVYIVAARRPVVGGLASATFRLAAPHEAYLIFKLAGGRLVLEDVDGTLHLPPGAGSVRLESV